MNARAAPLSMARLVRLALRFAVLFALLLAALAGRPNDAHAGISGQFVKGPYPQAVTSHSAEVRVEVDPPASVTLELDDKSRPAIADAGETAFHVFVLDGLAPSTRYTFTLASGTTKKTGELTTAPGDDTRAPISFLIYGDNRTDDSSHAAIVKRMTTDASDFLIHTGDFVERGDTPSLWKRFFAIEEPLLATRPLFATVGNHEIVDTDASLYLRYFGPASSMTPGAKPPLHHTFRWGFLRFFVLSGITDVPAEKAWLDDELAKSENESNVAFRIAVTHFGPWSSGPHGSNKKLHNTGIVDSLRSHHIDLVVSGHDHIYERGDANGIAYVVSGGGGAPTYEQGNKLESTRSFESTRHFIEVHASPDALAMKAVRTDGSIIESCALVKGAGWDCDHRAKGDAASADAFDDASEKRTATSRSACSCDVVGASDLAPNANGSANKNANANADAHEGSPANSRGIAIVLGAVSLFLLLLRRRLTYAPR